MTSTLISRDKIYLLTLEILVSDWNNNKCLYIVMLLVFIG